MGPVSGILEATMQQRFLLWILLVASMSLVGCGQAVVEDDVAVEVEAPIVEEGLVYENLRFGYRFVVPDGMPVYALNLEDQTARLAGPEDEIVFVAGEGTNVLTIRGIENEGSAHEWLTSHLFFFYPKGEAAQQIEALDGRQMLSLYGDGTSDSPARLSVVENQEDLIVITFEQEAELFANILSSFTFFP